MPSKFRVSAKEAGLTVAALLKQWLPDTPWSKARRLVERGKVRVGGEVTDDSTQPLRRAREGRRSADREPAGDRPRRRAARLDAHPQAGKTRGDARPRRRGAARRHLVRGPAGDGKDAPDPHPSVRGRPSARR